MHHLLTVFALACGLSIAGSVRICAFNIRSFGDSKISNETISTVIVDIIKRYDIALIQEVRDENLSAVKLLMDKLNSATPNTYLYEVSDPLGRSTYKERYLFIYRKAVVSVTSSYHYDDGSEEMGTDIFSREPFVVEFSSPHSAVQDFAIIPQHTSPTEAVKEIDALYDVVLDVKKRLGIEDMLIIGDLNAGCSYVKQSDWAQIRLRGDGQFQWLIPDSADTTVGHTECAYDRIIASGSAMKSAVIVETAVIYNFQEAFNLSDEMAQAVSDHYPVEVSLRAA
ncbi:deoxyribonuclease-1 [Callorhinchus milii]|uniref:deoxyribonuclease-1 n=1 Tax=Callorhinchus milii TaxID=7868 RepID=UPI001C3F78C0|nr:deoxyribonuclease-1 [Callorhinchus milii]